MEPSPAEAALQARLRAFAREVVAPEAARADAEGRLSRSVVEALAERGYLGAAVSPSFGGAGMSATELGLLHAEVGAACGSARSLLTVQSMVAAAIERWGDEAQKARWLPPLAKGEILGAFALTEPGAGSDLEAIEAAAVPDGDGFRIRADKRWISFGASAGVILVVARAGAAMSAFLIEGSAPGLVRRPVSGLLGLRGSELADLSFDDVAVPRGSRLGRGGLPGSLVVSSALDLGRYSVAWGAVGLIEGCLRESLGHARSRRQGGRLLEEHPLVQQLLARMITGARAARLLCLQAGARRSAGDPGALADTLVAKYFATTTASRASADAVQIHGASGCREGAPVERHFRDARVLEIIEGTTQLHEMLIARHAAGEHLDPGA